MGKPEQELQIKLCDYLRKYYPDVIFLSEASGIRVPPGLANILKKLKCERKLPDMFIAYPNGKYHGFFIELKKDGTTIYKKDGELVADPHIRAQFNTLAELHKLGYAAIFGTDYNKTIRLIDNYLIGMKKIAPSLDFEGNAGEKTGE